MNSVGQMRNVFLIEFGTWGYGYIQLLRRCECWHKCLSNNYNILLVAFLEIDHHGKLLLLGCALSQKILWKHIHCRLSSNHCQRRLLAIQSGSSDMFPHAHYRFSLPLVMQSVLNLSNWKNLKHFSWSWIEHTVILWKSMNLRLHELMEDVPRGSYLASDLV